MRNVSVVIIRAKIRLLPRGCQCLITCLNKIIKSSLASFLCLLHQCLTHVMSSTTSSRHNHYKVGSVEHKHFNSLQAKACYNQAITSYNKQFITQLKSSKFKDPSNYLVGITFVICMHHCLNLGSDLTTMRDCCNKKTVRPSKSKFVAVVVSG